MINIQRYIDTNDDDTTLNNSISAVGIAVMKPNIAVRAVYMAVMTNYGRYSILKFPVMEPSLFLE